MKFGNTKLNIGDEGYVPFNYFRGIPGSWRDNWRPIKCVYKGALFSKAKVNTRQGYTALTPDYGSVFDKDLIILVDATFKGKSYNNTQITGQPGHMFLSKFCQTLPTHLNDWLYSMYAVGPCSTGPREMKHTAKLAVSILKKRLTIIGENTSPIIHADFTAEEILYSIHYYSGFERNKLTTYCASKCRKEIISLIRGEEEEQDIHYPTTGGWHEEPPIISPAVESAIRGLAYKRPSLVVTSEYGTYKWSVKIAGTLVQINKELGMIIYNNL